MEKFKNLLAKARGYLGIALNFLKKLIGYGEKANEAIEEVEKQLDKKKE